jgi:hypothetical protein
MNNLTQTQQELIASISAEFQKTNLAMASRQSKSLLGLEDFLSECNELQKERDILTHWNRTYIDVVNENIKAEVTALAEELSQFGLVIDGMPNLRLLEGGSVYDTALVITHPNIRTEYNFNVIRVKLQGVSYKNAAAKMHEVAVKHFYVINDDKMSFEQLCQSETFKSRVKDLYNYVTKLNVTH